MGVEWSFVVPLHNTGANLGVLLQAFRGVAGVPRWELVLVDDGSSDGTFANALELTRGFPAPVVLVELARNFGEHAAVLEGYRRASGVLMVNLDDDLQNPPGEAVRLLRHLASTGAEAVYARYAVKRHHWVRNAGSWAVNEITSFLLGKPRSLYLSSMRAVTAGLRDRIVAYAGPYPYIDGLILGATNRIEALAVVHGKRMSGVSGYTVRKLTRLAMSVLFDFSVMPLRLASVLGLCMSLIGAAALVDVLLEMILVGVRQPGWGSLMGVLALFGGAQLLMLGIIGEYVGRAYLSVSRKPQSLVRSVAVRHPQGRVVAC